MHGRVCSTPKETLSPWKQTLVRMVRRGDEKSCGHDANDDGCESAESTQDVLGSRVLAVVVAAAAGAGARRLRATGSAARSAGGTAKAWGGAGVRVGRPEWLDFEGLGGGINLETEFAISLT